MKKILISLIVTLLSNAMFLSVYADEAATKTDNIVKNGVFSLYVPQGLKGVYEIKKTKDL